MTFWVVCPFCTAEAYTYSVDHLAQATQEHVRTCAAAQQSPPPLFKLSHAHWDAKADRERYALEHARQVGQAILGQKAALEAMARAGGGEVDITIRGQPWHLSAKSAT